MTIVLIAFFLIEGIASIMYAIEHRRELTGRWGWMLASGVITLVLAFLIYAGLPSTAAWAIGLLVGIDMVFGGTAFIGIAFATHKEAGAAAGKAPPAGSTNAFDAWPDAICRLPFGASARPRCRNRLERLTTIPALMTRACAAWSLRHKGNYVAAGHVPRGQC